MSGSLRIHGRSAAGAQLLADLVLQVDGQPRMRVGERLVLADQAAQLRRQAVDAGLEHGVVGQRHGFGGAHVVDLPTIDLGPSGG